MNNNFAISGFKIFGERHSGTNFIEFLVKGNLLNNGNETLEYDNWAYGHKHYPCWFELPLNFFHGPNRNYNFEGSEHVLFLVIYRNPYAWLRGMQEGPFDSCLFNIEFSQFIRTPWELDPLNYFANIEMQKNPWVDRNPQSGELFENVMKLRSAKIRTMQQIKDRVENIYYINYETLRDFPEQVLQEIANLFQLKRTPIFNPVLYNKGDPNLGIFTPRYLPISPDDMQFINEQLDREIERSIGYELVDEELP